MSRLTSIAGFSLSIALLFASSSQAAVIDFETFPAGGVPVDNFALTAPYTADGVTVSFSVDTTATGGGTTTPVFEQIGQQAGEPHNGPLTGFTNTSWGGAAAGDQAAAGFESQLGDWFIRFGDGRTRHTLVIDYTSTTTPVTGASGEIWDIDGRDPGAAVTGSEQWQVQAFDLTGNLLGTQDSPVGLFVTDPATLDAKPWTFGFSDLTGGDGDGIRQIRISYIGDDLGDTVGLAFNNFSPIVAVTPVPEPTSLLLCGFGIAAACATRRRNS